MPATARNTPASKTRRATPRRASATTASRTTPRKAQPDAIRLLKADHAKVDAMFKRYEKARSDHKAGLAREICKELRVHTRIEEEILYPALRAAAKAADDMDDLLDEAIVEHQGAKQLIAEIEAGSPGDDLFDAKVKVLGEYIRHHIKEEHSDIFPIARKRIDVKAIGERLESRKAELMKGPGEPATKGKFLSFLRH